MRTPTYDNFQQMPAQFQPVQAQAVTPRVDPGAQLASLGQATERAGHKMLDFELQQRAEQIQAATKEADVAFTSQLNTMLHDPEAGYLAQQGRNAVDGYEPTVQALDKLQRDALASLKDPQARKMAAPIFRDRAQSALAQVQKHAGQQRRAWQVNASEARAAVSISDAASNYADEEAFGLSLGTALNEVAEQGRLMGWGEEATELKRRGYIDEAFRMRYEAWRQSDPAGALADFQKRAGSVSPLVRDKIANDLFNAAAPQLAAQLNLVGGVGEAVARQTGEASQPRGVRNHNPGNIMKAPECWQGETEGSDSRYATFETPEAGIRAMGKTLLTYQQKHGLDTLEGIISRWAPATENDTRAYIATVAQAVGVGPRQAIDLTNPETLGAVTRAMIRVENGQQPYSDEQIANGLNAALTGADLPTSSAPATPRLPAWRNPDTLTGNPVVDALAPDRRIKVMQLAQAQAAQAASQARESLRTRVQDAAAEYLARGTASDAPSEEEFIHTYGQAEGVRRYEELQETAAVGLELQRVRLLPNTELARLLADATPEPGAGFAARLKNFEVLQRAVTETVKARQEDPIAYAMSNDAYGIEPLKDLRNPQTLAQTLAKRAGAMERIAADYGTRPAVLTKAEAEVFGEHLASLQAADKARVLGVVFNAAGAQGIQSIASQLKDKHQSIAIAGMLTTFSTTAGNSAAQLYLQGKEALEQKRAKIDQAAEIGTKAEIYKALEGVYQTPQGREAAAEAAFGIYAKLKADGGGDVDQAVRIATGGLMEFNGGKIAKPYGWQDSQFRDALRRQIPATLAAQGGEYLVGSARVSAADFAKMLPGARLQTYGQGSYLVMAGNDVVRDATGAPFILQVAP